MESFMGRLALALFLFHFPRFRSHTTYVQFSIGYGFGGCNKGVKSGAFLRLNRNTKMGFCVSYAGQLSTRKRAQARLFDAQMEIESYETRIPFFFRSKEDVYNLFML